MRLIYQHTHIYARSWLDTHNCNGGCTLTVTRGSCCGLVEDDTHASVLEGNSVHTTMLGAIFVVLVFHEAITSFIVGLII